MASVCVKTYPDLNIAALQADHRQDRELAVWYLLRFLDPQGNARVRRADLSRLIEQHALMSLSNLKRRLHRGDGTFWILAGEWVFYRSLVHVSAALGVLPERAPVEVPLDAFKGLARLRAYLYATWLNQGSNPVSRFTIEKKTGVPKQTQIRYEKAAHVQREKNMGVKPYERGDQVPDGAFLSRDGTLLNVPMPNTYLPLLTELPRGQLKKARQMIRGLFKERPNENIHRRYFKSGEQAHKCRRRSEVYFIDRRRSWHGLHLWDLCQA